MCQTECLRCALSFDRGMSWAESFKFEVEVVFLFFTWILNFRNEFVTLNSLKDLEVSSDNAKYE